MKSVSPQFREKGVVGDCGEALQKSREITSVAVKECMVCFFCHYIWNCRAVLKSIRNAYSDFSKNKSTWKNRYKVAFRILVVVNYL